MSQTLGAPEPIDFSRYRVAEAIAEMYAAGESIASIADQYFDSRLRYVGSMGEYAVALILAAYDRKGRWEPKA